MGIKFANGGYATLASSITNSDTSITLTTGQGARFPSLSGGDYFYATLIDTSNNLEIVKCTARSTDVLTVTRAQESTTARAYSAGDRIELRITAAGINDATDIDLILPSQTSNSGKYLTTNGTASSWGTVDLTNLSASNLTSGTIPKARMYAGAILQVVQTIKTDTFTTNSTSYVDVTGLSASITPLSTSSKILVLVNLSAQSQNASGTGAIVLRNSTAIGQAASAGSRRRSSFSGHGYTGDGSGDTVMSFAMVSSILDSPSTTSSTTYKVQIVSNGNMQYINQDQAGDSTDGCRTVSSITLMEVAG